MAIKCERSVRKMHIVKCVKPIEGQPSGDNETATTPVTESGDSDKQQKI